MKKLFLVRHGEAQAGSATVGDRFRPLSEKGKSDIAALKNRLSATLTGDIGLICSPALRTQQTAGLLTSVNTIVIEDLYYGAEQEYLDAISANSGTEVLILVGHNPVISLVARRLSGEQNSGCHPGTCIELHYSSEISDPRSNQPVRVITHHPPHV